MNILITGAKGFAGKNLAVALDNIKTGKDRRFESLNIEEIFLYDIDSDDDELDLACSKADIVFNFAGVNRPQNSEEFKTGNCDFVEKLISALKKHRNVCPIVLSSSIQASLIGRFEGSDYGKSKKLGEDIAFKYAEETGAKVMVYRFPNLFGKWCRPNYNSAVATFCYNIANDIPITVNDNSIELELLYIDDLVAEMISAMMGNEHRCNIVGTDISECDDGKYCFVPVTHKITLGEIVELINSFKAYSKTLIMPEIPDGSFAKKLYSTYLSYLPEKDISIPLKMNVDERGSFTELMRTDKCGQMSVNIIKPNVMKGQHWHNSKWEFFIVVSGKGLIQQRRIETNQVLNYYVSGDKIEAIHILPGYTHNIINLSDTEDLVTVMWANECFDANRPDTYWLPVEEE